MSPPEQSSNECHGHHIPGVDPLPTSRAQSDRNPPLHVQTLPTTILTITRITVSTEYSSRPTDSNSSRSPTVGRTRTRNRQRKIVLPTAPQTRTRDPSETLSITNPASPSTKIGDSGSASPSSAAQSEIDQGSSSKRF